ncbi:MAG TPA: protease pro-enzyme activation domain-containing protein [Bryobacteraceae bacterium]|nr:protease pro-enzyme activation domain-containing protein [Bryobacteraceae bacterium]
MTRLLIRIIFSLPALFSTALLAQQSRITGSIDDTRLVTLPRSVHPQARSRYDQGPVDPSLRLPFVTLTMKPSAGQQAELERLLDEQLDRSSANYHRWLTPEEFGDRFGLAPEDYAAIVSWLQSHALRIEQAARARNWVAFSGAARDIELAFHTPIHRYLVDGQPRIANAAKVSIPAALEDLVSGIRGLDDFWRLPPARVPLNTSSTGVNQLAPDDWATIYDLSPLYAMGIDGTGQRIGILGRSDMTQSYIDSFRSQFGIPPTTVEQHLIGPDPGITNAASEAALDLEWSGGIARGATVVFIYAGNFNDAAQGAIDQNLATVLSESAGTCEPLGGVGNRLMAQQANAQGITWVASSGDSGGAGCDPHGFFNTTGNATTISDGPAVSIPASYPEVTAVGGTQFNEGSGQYWRTSNNANGGSAISYIPEAVWNETGAGGLLASGGGASVYFPKPAWQAGPGVPADDARDVPDISFSAAGNHDPYMVVNANGQRATGGTSASAPSFGGVIALLNQYLVSKGSQAKPGLGNINSELYRLARTTTGVFHDITQGNNFVPCAVGSPGCVNGNLGFTAGPGYDQATGLGSVDVYQLVTQWNSPAVTTSTSLAASPSSITFGDSVQLTAAVTPAAAGAGVPSGSVAFSAGRNLLGAAPLINVGGVAMATLTATGPRLPVGATTVTATYSGDSVFNPSNATASVSVAGGPAGSFVSINITPNPAHEGQFIHVTLTEEAGVATTITGWTINSNDDFSLFAQDFGSTTLPAFGILSATITSATPAVLPSARVYVFTGVDAGGRQWSQQYTLTLEGPLGVPGITLLSAPSTVQQNPAADPACQWSQQLSLQEQLGFSVELTRLLAGGADWTSRIQQLFGTTHLAPLGMLQAHVCWPGPNPPPQTTFEVDGTDQTGVPVTATFQATYTSPAASAVSLSAAQNTVTMSVPAAPAFAGANLAVNLTGGGAWTVTVLPANRSTTWLTASEITSTSANQVSLQASAAGLSTGVYNATLLIQAANAVPQYLEVPVVFMVGATGTSIAGLTNGASFAQVYAPGMLASIFGSQLAPSVQIVTNPPLPSVLSGVSATVNGVAAPFYYVSPNQLNIQIPYETGSGAAVLGVNNNGQVASFVFQVAPAAPGIFMDLYHPPALVPFSSGKRGDTIPVLITGDGQVSPALPTGATPFTATPLNLLPQPLLPVTVTVGGVPAQVVSQGISSGVAGLTQINFMIPPNAPLGAQAVVVSVGGVASNAVTLTVSQ